MNTTNKWTAFALSFVVPGAGHLWLGNWLCIVWFCLAAFLMVTLQNILLVPSALSITVNLFSFLCLGLLSAKHIENYYDSKQRALLHTEIHSEIICRELDTNKIYARIEIAIPISKNKLWEIISNLENFLCIDPFHSRIVIMGTRICQGTDIALEHQVLGFRFLRFGRILSWREGQGYAFSDLSAKGPRIGFPHVFFIEISPLCEKEKFNYSQLSITVKGKWTVRWVPRVLRHWWLNKICQEHALLLMKGLSYER